MQELLLAKNRHKKIRITALGGALIGLAIAGAVSALVVPQLLGQQASQYLEREESALRLADAKLKTVRAEAAAAQTAMTKAIGSCEPQLQLALSRLQTVNKAIQMVSEFPAFKTEPYKSTHAAIMAGLELQRADALKLVSALDGKTTATPVCTLSQSEVSVEGAALWDGESMSLYKDGWHKGLKK